MSLKTRTARATAAALLATGALLASAAPAAAQPCGPAGCPPCPPSGCSDPPPPGSGDLGAFIIDRVFDRLRDFFPGFPGFPGA